MSDLEPEDFADLPGPLEALAAELDAARAVLATFEVWGSRLADPADPLTARAGAFAEVAQRRARNLRQSCGTLTATLEVLERKGLDLPELVEDALPNLAEDAEALREVVACLAFLDADPEATVTARDASTTASENPTVGERYAAIIAAKADAGTRHLGQARRLHLRAIQLARRGECRRVHARTRERSRPRPRKQLAHLMASASSEDPSPTRWQGALVGASMLPARLRPESEEAPT